MELIKIENDIALLNKEVSIQIAEFERKAKEIKEKEEELKKAILKEMELHNVNKIETEELSISYVAEFDRESFDSKRFKAENQDLYDCYITMTTVKPSIRIKVK